MVDGSRDSCTMWLSWGTQTTNLWHFSVTSKDALQQSLSPNHHSWHKTNLRISLLQGLWNNEMRRFCRRASISAADCLWSLSWLSICPALPSFQVKVSFGWHKEQGKVKLLLCFQPPLSTGVRHSQNWLPKCSVVLKLHHLLDHRDQKKCSEAQTWMSCSTYPSKSRAQTIRFSRAGEVFLHLLQFHWFHLLWE